MSDLWILTAIRRKEEKMRLLSILLSVLIMGFIIAPVSIAGDFDWMEDFNIKAEADLSGFKARLSTRFNIGGVKINTVLSSVDNSVDAYMVLRLGEMSDQPTEDVIKKYKSGKGKGWGSLAKSLGIKPGSKEFKALKSGDDLYDKKHQGKDKDKKGKSKKN
ncbi:hypothetical protein ACFL2E_09755 [Thermodesulfobacteriota bacterium]